MEAYEAWMRRLTAAQAARRPWETVWELLFDKWRGRLAALKTGKAEKPELANEVAEFATIIRPHLIGDARECKVRVRRAYAGEDLTAKTALAEQMGPQATALAENIGFSAGRSGQSAWGSAVDASLWGVGVVLFGFTPQEEAGFSGQGPGADREQGSWFMGQGSVVSGQGQTESPGLTETLPTEHAPQSGVQSGVDESDEAAMTQGPPDAAYAQAGREELADAGLPWARAIDPRDVLVDPTYQDARKADWFAVREYLTPREAAAVYGTGGGKWTWKATHASVPVWTTPQEDRGDDGRNEKRLIEFTHVYTRNPQAVLVLPSKGSGVEEIVATRNLDLGIEGLPVVFVGSEWPAKQLYPKPLLAAGYDAAVADNDFQTTLHSSGLKLRTMTLVDETAAPGLTEEIANSTNGIAKVKGTGKPLGELIHNHEVSGIRREHIDLAQLARENAARQTGASDMALGQREPGDKLVREVQQRQAALSARLSGIVRPYRMAEGECYRYLIAIAYAKRDVLHGLILPVQAGDLVAFDAEQALVGELLDYEFEVRVFDKLTTIEEADDLQAAVELVSSMQPVAAQEGTALRITPLIEELLRRRNIPRVGEVIQALPPPAPVGPDGQPLAPEGAGQMDGGPPGPDALVAMLQQMPEGDPQEEQLLALLAQQLGQAAPAPQAA